MKPRIAVLPRSLHHVLNIFISYLNSSPRLTCFTLGPSIILNNIHLKDVNEKVSNNIFVQAIGESLMKAVPRS